MISDELGLTKSAIYQHFHTRDELLAAIVEPVIGQLAGLVESTESHRGARARADAMLTGYVGLAVAHRSLLPVLTGDPSVAELLRERPELGTVVQRQTDLLAGAEPGAGGRVRAALVMSGIAAAVGGDYGGLAEGSLQAELIPAGRRTLGLRAPRHG